ncbi:MAG: gas vesicle protein GvpG [Halobacteria archaeon]
MLLVDDLLIKPFFSLLGILQMMALDELFDVDEIKSQLKENQLMYEIGEKSETEYEAEKQRLETQLQMAEEARKQIKQKIEVKN